MRAKISIAMGVAALAAMPVASAQAPTAPQPESIDALARDIARLESLRTVKDVQRAYAHYAQYGLWDEMAALFGDSGRIVWGDRTVTGRSAIAAFLREHGAPAGRVAGALNTELIEDPLVTLAADGTTAKGRWRGLSFRGDGAGRAWIEGGLYENDYARVNDRWTIATLRYFPQFEGDYATGWANVGNKDLPIVPYHFTPDSLGVPIPAASGAAPKSGATLAALSARVAALNDEDEVRNLQSAYGYYVDRKMWDDIVDLFADDAVVEVAGVGRFQGKAGVRQFLERMGPAGLVHGELNERPQFDAIVKVSPGGAEAYARGIEIGMTGQASKRQAGWEIDVFRNRFVKQAGVWKFRELRIQPLVKADYYTGWGKAAPGTKQAALPPFLGPNPTTGRAVAAPGLASFAARPLTPAIAAAKPLPARDLTDLRRRWLRSLTYDGTLNLSAAYGYYLDDFQWPEMSGIFAVKGNKQSPFAGYYFGRDRIAAAATAMWGKTPDAKTAMRAGISFHSRFQPVIHVSHDGRSANLRTRLFQPRTAKWDPASGKPNPNGFNSGMYPNDQVVLEDGIYRFWTVTIDEHYFTSPDWKGGWSAAKEPPPGSGSRPSPLLTRLPPDVPITELGRREEGFRGGTGKTIDWPGILPMWFHYRNPVSGRTPERYWPDCVPCEKLPETSMTRHGYQLPPSGPQSDGVEIAAKR